MRTTALVAALGTVSCATLQTNGPTQRVAVTSTPPAAEVFLDGRAVGITPVEVVVSRRNAEPVIRVEKDGFRPREQRLRRSTSWWLLSDVCSGALIGYSAAWITGRYAGAAVGGVPVALDYVTGAAYKFPSRVKVSLAPVAAGRMEVGARGRGGAGAASGPGLGAADGVRGGARGRGGAGGASGRLELPRRLRADLRRWLVRGAAATVSRYRDRPGKAPAGRLSTP